MADQDTLDNFCFFFTALAKEYPKELIGWFTAAEVSIEKHPILIDALRFGGLRGEAIRLAQKANWPAKKILSIGTPVGSFLTVSVELPDFIPCMGSHFVATGDVRYVRRIIDALETRPTSMKDPNQLKELKELAQKHLADLIFKHDKVYRLCLEEAKIRKGEVAAFLNRLIDELHQAQKNGFPKPQPGLFNGFVFVTEDSHFEKQWDSLPIMGAPICRQIRAIPYPRKNKIINVFIMFNGMELDNDLNGDVIFDLEIVDPKGNKMSEFHDLQAINRKIPSRFFLQKADQPVTFELCPDDWDLKKGEQKTLFPGIYTFNAHLKDQISGKDLKLSSTLEVLPE